MGLQNHDIMLVKIFRQLIMNEKTKQTLLVLQQVFKAAILSSGTIQIAGHKLQYKLKVKKRFLNICFRYAVTFTVNHRPKMTRHGDVMPYTLIPVSNTNILNHGIFSFIPLHLLVYS